MPVVNQDFKARLMKLGVSILHAHDIGLPDDCVLEPPCSLKWMIADYSLRMGAFSYAVSGYYFGVEIGRYVSIGESVQVGRGSHPVNWASTSPVLYQRHESVLDFTVEQARDYTPQTPYIAPKKTIIGNDVYIGHGAFIMQGVRVGDGAVIGAQSVVTKDVPSYSVVAGNPATIRRMRFEDKLVERFILSPWWRYAFWDLRHLSIVNPESFIAGVEEMAGRGVAFYEPKHIIVKDL